MPAPSTKPGVPQDRGRALPLMLCWGPGRRPWAQVRVALSPPPAVVPWMRPSQWGCISDPQGSQEDWGTL